VLAGAAAACARLGDLQPEERALLVDSLATGLSVLSASGGAGASNDGPEAVALVSHALCLESVCAEAEKEEARAREAQKASAAPRRKPKSADSFGWDWGRLREKVARALSAAAASAMPLSEEGARALLGACCALLGSAAAVRDRESREHVLKAVARICARGELSHTLDASADRLLELLPLGDHVPAALAELCQVAAHAGDIQDTRLATALILAVTGEELVEYERQAQQDSAALRHTAVFIEELAVRLPEIVGKNFALLESLLAAQKATRLRCAVVTALSRVIRHKFQNEAEEAPGVDTTRNVHNIAAQLDLLVLRVHDTAVHVRTRALQGLEFLASEMALPLGHWVLAAQLATERLEDKGSLTRKAALQLLRALMQKQPFGGQLSSAAWEGSLKQHEAVLQSMEDEEKAEEDGRHAQEAGQLFEQDKEAAEGASDGETDEQVEDPAPGPLVGAPTPRKIGLPGGLDTQRTLVASLRAGVAFCTCMEKGLAHASNLFTSPVSSDVTESMQFVIEAVCFQIEGAEAIARRTLLSILSREDAVREATLDTFMQLYADGSPLEAAQSMAQLAAVSNMGESTAMREAVRLLTGRGQLDESNARLWDILEESGSGSSTLSVRGAVIMQEMAGSKPSAANVDLLLEKGLPDVPQGAYDPMLAQLTTHALAGMGPRPAELGSNFHKSFRKPTEKVFRRLVSTVAGSFGKRLPEESWYGAAQGAIAAIFALHPHAEAVCSEILHHMHAELTRGKECGTVGANGLARFLFAFGQVAMQQMVALDQYRKGVQKRSADPEEGAAEDDDPNGVSSVDESEQVMKDGIAEIVGGGSECIVAAFAPFLSEVCHDRAMMTAHPKLCSSALLALVKVMAIDAAFCKRNFPLFLGLLQDRAVEPHVRRNLVIAMGDLAVRHPLIVDKHKEQMYRALDDPDMGVRRLAISVLSFLILNGVILPQGHTGHIATLLLDQDRKIRDMAANFFVEFDGKVDGRGESQLYHSLPDILSYLLSLAMERASFEHIMSHLLGFVKKEAHSEFLLKNFLTRLDVSASDLEPNRRLAFCLKELSPCEKGTKRMAELFRFYKDSLTDPEILEYVSAAVAKMRRASKVGSAWREATEEMMARLAEYGLQPEEEAPAAAMDTVAPAETLEGGVDGEEGEAPGQRPALGERDENVTEAQETAAEPSPQKPAPRRGRSTRASRAAR
jgi:condensin complex subunit 1